jgi:hypothetical protein
MATILHTSLKAYFSSDNRDHLKFSSVIVYEPMGICNRPATNSRLYQVEVCDEGEERGVFTSAHSEDQQEVESLKERALQVIEGKSSVALIYFKSWGKPVVNIYLFTQDESHLANFKSFWENRKVAEDEAFEFSVTINSGNVIDELRELTRIWVYDPAAMSLGTRMAVMSSGVTGLFRNLSLFASCSAAPNINSYD